MIDLGPHWIYIVSGYAGAVVVVAALVAWTVLASRRVKARLAELERR